MDRKLGEDFRSLPLDLDKEVSSYDIDLLKELFPDKKNKKNNKKQEENYSDSDSDSDDDSDTNEEHEDVSKNKFVLWNEIKITFIASILFILLNNKFVDDTIKKMGGDGFKLLFIKIFLFSVIFFVLRYKFM
jgi:hypothetical protein